MQYFNAAEQDCSIKLTGSNIHLVKMHSKIAVKPYYFKTPVTMNLGQKFIMEEVARVYLCDLHEYLKPKDFIPIEEFPD